MERKERAAVVGPPSRRREALENAWREAEGAEHADAAGRADDRDVRMGFAIMWATIAQAEKTLD